MAKSIMEARTASFYSRLRAWWASLGKPRYSIAERIRTRVGQIRRGEYEGLGKILLLQMDSGTWIQFPSGEGPSLGRFPDGDVDILDPWRWSGLPPRYEGQTTPCAFCERVPCKECWPGDTLKIDGEAFLAALEIKARGLRTVAGRELELLPGERICSYGNQMNCCGGAGVIAGQDKPCEQCGGSGKVTCRRCQGAAMVSSGKMPFGEICARCGGSGYARETMQQDTLAVAGFQRGHVALGPLRSLVIQTFGDKLTQGWACEPDADNDLPWILAPDGFELGKRVTIWGGVLRTAEQPSLYRRMQREGARRK